MTEDTVELEKIQALLYDIRLDLNRDHIEYNKMLATVNDRLTLIDKKLSQIASSIAKRGNDKNE